MSQGAQKKRPLSDTLLLWGTGILVCIFGVGFFWAGNSFHIPKRWQFYVGMNAAFCALVLWRFRTWFRHSGLRFLFPVWLVGHLLAYGFLTHAGFNVLLYVILFPAEVTVMRWIELRRAAIHRQKELGQADRNA